MFHAYARRIPGIFMHTWHLHAYLASSCIPGIFMHTLQVLIFGGQCGRDGTPVADAATLMLTARTAASGEGYWSHPALPPLADEVRRSRSGAAVVDGRLDEVRRSRSGAAVVDGRLLLVGGLDSSHRVCADVVQVDVRAYVVQACMRICTHVHTCRPRASRCACIRSTGMHAYMCTRAHMPTSCKSMCVHAPSSLPCAHAYVQAQYMRTRTHAYARPHMHTRTHTCVCAPTYTPGGRVLPRVYHTLDGCRQGRDDHPLHRSPLPNGLYIPNDHPMTIQ